MDGGINMETDTIIKWGLIFGGLILINLFPSNIDWEFSGLLLSLGIIFYVYGVIWTLGRDRL